MAWELFRRPKRGRPPTPPVDEFIYAPPAQPTHDCDLPSTRPYIAVPLGREPEALQPGDRFECRCGARWQYRHAGVGFAGWIALTPPDRR
jgi:hypothetical protein